MVHGALACGEDSDSVRKELAERRSASEAALCERFRRAQSDVDLPKNCDAAGLARFYATVVQGMAVQAAGGATHEDLLQTAEIALRAWPS